MTLSVILARKGSNVVTTAPHRALREIVQQLSDMGIGAVLVVDPEQRLLGIISERDIVRAIARNPVSVLDESVSQHMTARVVSATPQTSVSEAMAQMTEGRFRHMPIMAEGKVAGVVSIGDLVKHRLSEMEAENKAMLNYITAA